MFGFGSKDKKSDKRSASAKDAAAGGQGKEQGSQRLAGEALRAQALANAKAARVAIGEDTLDKIAAAMAKKQKSVFEQAKRNIQNSDAERVAAEILAMIDEKN